MNKSRTWIERCEPPLPATCAVLIPGDIHLGAMNRSKALLELLASIQFTELWLLGDVLDHTDLPHFWKKKWWQIKRGKIEHVGRLRKRDRRVLQCIDERRKEGARILYTPGNHDEKIGQLLQEVALLLAGDPDRHAPDVRDVLLSLDCIAQWDIRPFILEEVNGVRFYAEHGDNFDHIVHKRKIITGLGSFFWELLKEVEKEKHTFASFAKRQVKTWTKISNQVAAGVSGVARHYGAQYAFAGHTHDPWHTNVDGVEYINMGSFDLHESACVTISHDGQPTLHRVYTRDAPIKNPRRKKGK